MSEEKTPLELAHMRYQAAGMACMSGKTDDELAVMRKEYEDSCIAYNDLLPESVIVTIGSFTHPNITECWMGHEYVDLSIAENRKGIMAEAAKRAER